jgi:hypothetical protein
MNLLPHPTINIPPAAPLQRIPSINRAYCRAAHSHRFASDAGIGKLSGQYCRMTSKRSIQCLPHQVRKCKWMNHSKKSFSKNLLKIQELHRREGHPHCVEEIRRPARAMRHARRPQGLYALNKATEEHLHQLNWLDARSVYYQNRPIILTRNYYEHGLFKRRHRILRLNENGMMMAWFEDSTGALKAVRRAS